MTRTVNDIRKATNARYKKNISTRGVDPQRFTDLLQLAFLRELRYLTGLPESFVPGQSQPVVALGNSLRNEEYMLPLLVTKIHPDPQALVDGKLDLTNVIMVTNFSYFDIKNTGSGYELKTYPGDHILAGEVFDRLSHPNKKPTKKHPVCFFSSPTNLSFEPSAEKIQIIYYKVPLMPFYDYYIDANDNEVYLPEGSTHPNDSVLPSGSASRTQQIELDFRAYESVENRVYEMISARNQDQFHAQIAQLRKQSGQ